MNINAYCGDTAEHIAENRRRLARALGVEVDQILVPHQVHGTETRVVDAQLLRSSSSERAALLEGVDALTTNQPGVCIGVSTADCVPVLLYDPIHQATAAVHAGWRGASSASLAMCCTRWPPNIIHTHPTCVPLSGPPFPFMPSRWVTRCGKPLLRLVLICD